MAANLPIIHHALNGGEVSPRMVARADQNKHMSCCETMLNWIPLVVGGAYVRPGTQYVATTKTVADHPLKIIRPFVPARDQAYTMEWGHLYVRFFMNGLPVEVSPGVPFELVTPYVDTDIALLVFVQSVDVCYIIHGSYPVHKLTRTSISTFTLNDVGFNPPATVEDEPTGTALGMGTLTPSATTGLAVTFTASAGTFLAADVGRIITSGASRAVIGAVAGAVATGDILDNFPSTSAIPATDWRLVLSPQTTLDVTNDKTEIGEIVTLTAGIAAFRASDAGKAVTLFGGLALIDSVDSTTSVTATIKSRLKDITVSNPTPTRAWTLEVGAWSATLGYPTCGCFFQGRLWLFQGLTINGSVTEDFENFAKGADADSAIAETISDDDIDEIVWGKGDKTLKIGTGSGVYQCVATAQSGALTPTSFRVEPIDPNGGAKIQPLRVSPVLIYADASKRELRELSYNFAEDNFRSPHLFRFAEHLMDGLFINEIFYVSSPDSIVYVIRNDGVLLGLSYEQVENVIAWFRIETDGQFMSGCRIPRPTTGKDWVWAIVSRENGTFVEYFEPDHPSTGREWNDLHTDSAVVTTHNASFLVTGGAHLEGRTVKVVGDGCIYEDAIITGGQFTLTPQVAVNKIEYGLGYDARVVPVEPAVAADQGGPFIARGYSKIGVRIQKALGLTLRAYRVMMNEPGDDTIAGEQLTFRKAYHDMDEHVPLQRGKKCVLNLGYDPFARIEVRQALPLPAEVLNVVGRLHVGDEWDCETYNENEVFF